MGDSAHTPTEPEPYRIRARVQNVEKKTGLAKSAPEEPHEVPPSQTSQGEAAGNSPPADDAAGEEARRGGRKGVFYAALFAGTLTVLALVSFAAADIQNERAAAEMEGVSGERVYVEEAPEREASNDMDVSARIEERPAEQTAEEADPQNPQEPAEDVEDEEPAEHEHEWTEIKETVHHEAEEATVHHEAEYADAVERHTVCNICLERIDGATREHAAATGHRGYTTGVPVTVKRLVKEAWDETVVVKEAWDETVVAGRECASCGEVEKNEEKPKEE